MSSISANGAIGSDIQKCAKCGVEKVSSEFYFKSLDRLDSICKSCRKRERQNRYKQAMQQKEAGAGSGPALNRHEGQAAIKYTSADFRDLVKVFQILANVRDRVRRKAKRAEVDSFRTPKIMEIKVI